MRVMHPFQVLVGLCNIFTSFKIYVTEPNVFLRYHVWGIIVGVFNSFGHEQYPFKNNVNLQCLIIEYPNEVLVSL
jgi:hypothetical protein